VVGGWERGQLEGHLTVYDGCGRVSGGSGITGIVILNCWMGGIVWK
jgi:hypothetical protein